MISPEDVHQALKEVGLDSELRTDLHVAEVLVTSSRGRGYVIRFLHNGKAAVSARLDVVRQRLCDTVAEVLAAVEDDTSG